MLPAAPKGPEKTPHLIDVEAGTWWRFVAETETVKNITIETGTVLLLKEVRVVDGEIHTLVFGYHPTWGEGEHRVLLQEFLVKFAREHEGDAVRQAEIDALMERITQTGQRIATPPDDAELEQLLLTRKAEEIEKAAATSAEGTQTTGSCEKPQPKVCVPDALLPGGDILKAQQVAESQIAVLNERMDWIQARKDEMTKDMKLVGIYHKEKVAVSLALISGQTAYVNRMMSSVRTMRLFLGEEQFHDHLVKGQGAPADAPLFFMQKMLYLDEELFIHDLMDGFNGEMMNDLGQILTDNPHLVQRMMPYERCVVITKARRKTRQFSPPKNLAGIFDNMASADADRQIQILVRDGENVHIIAADEDTSRAERLFPSQSEIADIFKEYKYNREARQIGVQDIEYTDKRDIHDARALFYKRFLLILWGAHERLQVFGDFLPQGANWLAETLHSEKFRFIHDEEAVLDDGRMSLACFHGRNMDTIQSGSRVLCHWKNVFNPVTAPSCYSESVNGHNFLEVDFEENYGLCIVGRDGKELVVKAPVSRFSHAQGLTREFQTQVVMQGCNTTWGGSQKHQAKGFLVLDDVSEADLLYYMGSRKAREGYLEYLHLFHEALMIKRNEAPGIEKAVREALLLDPGVKTEVMEKALKIWRSANRWVFPTKETQRKRLCDIARLLMLDIDEIKSGAIDADRKPVRICVTAQAQIKFTYDTPMEFMGQDMPQCYDYTYSLSKRQGLVLKDISVDLMDGNIRPGTTVIWEDESFAWPKLGQVHPFKTDGSLARAKPVLATMGSDLLDMLSRPAHEGSAQTTDADLAETMSHLLTELGRITFKASNERVKRHVVTQDIALVHGGNYFNANGEISRELYSRITAQVNLPVLAYRLGCFEQLKAFCHAVYRFGDDAFDGFGKDHRDGKPLLELHHFQFNMKKALDRDLFMMSIQEYDYRARTELNCDETPDLRATLVRTIDGNGRDRKEAEIRSDIDGQSIWMSEPGRKIAEIAGFDTTFTHLFEV